MVPIFCTFSKVLAILHFAIKCINTLCVLYDYTTPKERKNHNDLLAMLGVSFSLQLFSPIPCTTFDHSKLSNSSTVHFDPAVTLKILSTLSVDQVKLQQKVYTGFMHAGDGDTVFRLIPRSLLCNKNVNKFLNLELSKLKVCRKTEF